MRELGVALKLFCGMVILTGVSYPLLILAVAWATMNDKANGSFIKTEQKILGSALIGQKFSADKYFWGRPSASDYNALQSGGSNLGPTSAALKKTVEERRLIVIKAHGGDAKAKVPSELLYASGSGLDPHINIDTALFQIGRIMAARGLEKQKLTNLIQEHTKEYWLGPSVVNVLELNIALDNLHPHQG